MGENKGAVLICPLNWGLGHASRCIPLVMELINQKQEVIIAADGAPLSLLRNEFPGLQFIILKGTEIKYSKKGFSVFSMLIQAPKMLWGIYLENKRLKEIISRHKIIAVISDNRYGLRTRKIKSILITHQLNIQLPVSWKWMEGIVNKLNHFFIGKFDECWVPDNAGHPNISGDLSHNGPKILNLKYIGSLSRIKAIKEQAIDDIYDVMVMLSGPEPQRSVLEQLLIKKLNNAKKKVLMVRGKPEELDSPPNIGNITFANHLSSDIIKFHLIKCQYLICRSGYSTLMDLAAVGRSAIIIPTPGQSEQEYLAKYHHACGNHFMLKQGALDFSTAFYSMSDCRPFAIRNETLVTLIESFLQNKKG